MASFSNTRNILQKRGGGGAKKFALSFGFELSGYNYCFRNFKKTAGREFVSVTEEYSNCEFLCRPVLEIHANFQKNIYTGIAHFDSA
jgi:hypothetical protein